MRSSDERDVFLIPQNFIDTGTIMGGQIKLRNAVEALVMVLASGVPLCYLPLPLNYRIMILIAVCVPLGILGIVGINGDSLTQFLAHWWRFLRRRRIITPTQEGNYKATRTRHSHIVNVQKYEIPLYLSKQ